MNIVFIFHRLLLAFVNFTFLSKNKDYIYKYKIHQLAKTKKYGSPSLSTNDGIYPKYTWVTNIFLKKFCSKFCSCHWLRANIFNCEFQHPYYFSIYWEVSQIFTCQIVVDTRTLFFHRLHGRYQYLLQSEVKFIIIKT